eukprot:TRINITY_DN19070_c0_g2_i1.p1 TRINITY_DN19070_c0_g2~~TRINITY_DN19070_c0_g2_i1.p1  ORF type:complete len:187 (-),score=40.07 TRINITY_DN19070_c0_g2_i1:219-779(-)
MKGVAISIEAMEIYPTEMSMEMDASFQGFEQKGRVFRIPKEYDGFDLDDAEVAEAEAEAALLLLGSSSTSTSIFEGNFTKKPRAHKGGYAEPSEHKGTHMTTGLRGVASLKQRRHVGDAGNAAAAPTVPETTTPPEPSAASEQSSDEVVVASAAAGAIVRLPLPAAPKPGMPRPRLSSHGFRSVPA